MDDQLIFWIPFVCIPLIAFLYSSVGHGGASGYLALMTIMGLSQDIMKPTALMLNMVVSAIAFFYFWKAGFFRWKLFIAFAVGSIPFSFIGGMIKTDPSIYKSILGFFLIIATLKLIGVFDKKNSDTDYQPKHVNLFLAIVIGSVIGFLSGLIGIGGGIILSPVILLLGWANLKESAAVSALFIFVNSVSGFAGHVATGIQISPEIALMAGLATIGGIAGSYYGTYRLNPVVLKKVLAFILLFASMKLLIL